MFKRLAWEKGKRWMRWVGIGLMIFLIQSSVFAAVEMTERTGTIIIVRPDDTEIVVRVEEVLPEIPAGSTIIILFGSANIRCTEGYYVEVIVGASSAYLGCGDAIVAGFNLWTFEGYIIWLSGRIDITYPGGSMILHVGHPSFNTGIGEIKAVVEIEEDPGDISPSQ